MHVLVQPGFQPPCILIQFFGFGYAAIRKAQLLGGLFDEQGVFFSIIQLTSFFDLQIYSFIDKTPHTA